MSKNPLPELCVVAVVIAGLVVAWRGCKKGPNERDELRKGLKMVAEIYPHEIGRERVSDMMERLIFDAWVLGRVTNMSKRKITGLVIYLTNTRGGFPDNKQRFTVGDLEPGEEWEFDDLHHEVNGPMMFRGPTSVFVESGRFADPPTGD